MSSMSSGSWFKNWQYCLTLQQLGSTEQTLNSQTQTLASGQQGVSEQVSCVKLF